MAIKGVFSLQNVREEQLVNNWPIADRDSPYSDDVFKVFAYKGSGAQRNLNTGINFSTKSGMILSKWRKGNFGTIDANITDTLRGINSSLNPGSTVAIDNGVNGTVNGFLTNGYSVGTNALVNNGNADYVSYQFQEATKFFKLAQLTKSAGSNATLDLSSLGTVGMVIIKRIDTGATGDWYVFHRSATTGKLCLFNTNAASATLGHITVTGQTLNLINGVIANGNYIVYAWAHDASELGIIQCGEFTTNSSGIASVTLGWEPQALMVKALDTTGSWEMVDTQRGWTDSANTFDMGLGISSDQPEFNALSGGPNPTGFASGVGDPLRSSSTRYLYMAIRKPSKPAVSANDVFYSMLGITASAEVDVPFNPDISIYYKRTTPTNRNLVLRNTPSKYQNNGLSTYNISNGDFSRTNKFTQNSDGATNTVAYFLARKPNVLEVLNDVGTSAQKMVTHGLEAVPEMILRSLTDSASSNFYVYHKDLPTGYYLSFASNSAMQLLANVWGNGTNTNKLFSVGDGSTANSTPNLKYVSILLASLAGISKVGSYTGNGTNQIINCQFTTGARFILIKRTDAVGDWYIWDVSRGLVVASNNPHSNWNDQTSEITTDNSVDPHSTGFKVIQLSATNINVNAATYIFLAFA